MKIGVCIKQVPLGSARMDSVSGALDRSSSGSVINPYDRYAIEAALQAAESLEEEAGGSVEVLAVSMGPPSAEKILREALALGVHRAILLSDSALSGSDVSATSRALAGVFEKMAPVDIIFCGQQTSDGDTAQLPIALAARLGIPALGWVKKIEYIRRGEFSALQELSEGTVKVFGPWPALFAVGQEGLRPRAPSLSRRLAAQSMPLAKWGLAGLPDPDPKKYGFAGSPTRVQKIYSPEFPVKALPIRLEPARAAALIREALKEAAP
jgi:electron transfer flavoprotein beta subunit